MPYYLRNLFEYRLLDFNSDLLNQNTQSIYLCMHTGTLIRMHTHSMVPIQRSELVLAFHRVEAGFCFCCAVYSRLAGSGALWQFSCLCFPSYSGLLGLQVSTTTSVFYTGPRIEFRSQASTDNTLAT